MAYPTVPRKLDRITPGGRGVVGVVVIIIVSYKCVDMYVSICMCRVGALCNGHWSKSIR